MTALSRRRRLSGLVPALALAMAFFALPALAADAQAPRPLEGARLDVEQIEAALERPDLRDQDLEELKARLAPLAERIGERLGEIEPRFGELEARLKELGKKPDAGAPPEDPKITAERDDLTKQFGEIDSELKQARLLALRADQLNQRVIERRRSLFAAEVLTRSQGILRPGFWTDVAAAIPGEMRSLRIVGTDWWSYAAARGGVPGLVATLVALGLLAALALGLRRLWQRRRARAVPGLAGTRLGKALAAWRVLFGIALPPVAAVAATVTIADANGLVPPRILDIAHSLIVAIFVAALMRGTSEAVLAPADAGRRLLDIEDGVASRLRGLLVWSARVFGAAAVLNTFHKAVVAPVALTQATSAAMALVVALSVALTLFATRPGVEADAEAEAGAAVPENTAASRSHQWLRIFGWLMAASVIGALAIGYVGLAAFIVGRIVIAAAVLGLVFLAIAFVEAVVTEGLAAATPRGRRIAAMLGLAPMTLELIGAVVAGIVKLSLLAVAAFVVAGPWGVHVVDIGATFSGAFFGLKLGELSVNFGAVLAAVAVFGIGLLATRALQRWLETRLLPRTRLDPSLQHSVRQIVGYIGFIVATMLTLAQLGINLENIAIVAGALSVGIGFGLQSIVSNFVSGLILLTERPIRVGDTINVKGEEGYVRRISVRATEIETFERSSVIIPNSDLITGVVKNWTHANTTGRIIIPVGVSYDCDADRVRDELIAAACDHPQVLQTPAPRVFFMKFGDSALHFELRCVVSNVDYSLTVKSDLHFSILHRFRKAGIEIPYPQQEVRLRRGAAGTMPMGDAPVPKRDAAGPDDE